MKKQHPMIDAHWYGMVEGSVETVASMATAIAIVEHNIYLVPIAILGYIAGFYMHRKFQKLFRTV